MTEPMQVSVADRSDQHTRLVAGVMLVMAVRFAMGAGTFLVPEATAASLRILEVGAIVVVIALLLPMIAWKVLRLSKADRALYYSADGYVAQTLLRAKNASFVSTFVLLTLADGLTKGRFEDVPARFVVQVVLAVMLGVFGGTFFLLNRDNADLVDDVDV